MFLLTVRWANNCGGGGGGWSRVYDIASMITSKPKQSPQVPLPLSSRNISIQIDLVATVG